MSKLDFELSEFQDRHARVRQAMARQGVDLLLVVHPVNINYLIGWRGKAYQELQVLFFPVEPAPLVFLTRLSEQFEAEDQTLADELQIWSGFAIPGREPEDPVEAVARLLSEKRFAGRRIGLETPAFYMTPQQYVRLKSLLGNSLVLEANRLVEDVKMVKSPAELAYIRRAADIADRGMEACAQAIDEGATELAVCGEIYRAMMANGGEISASPINFVSGERSHYSHGMPTERQIRRGDLIGLEYGATYRRYTSTIGRALCLGAATPRMKEVYEIVREASDAAIAAIRAGVPATVPHDAAKGVIEGAGMGAYRMHLTGYGVSPGFSPLWMEAVQLEDGNPYTLEAGMVVSIEPPVYIPEERLGQRVIDNVLVTDSGSEILSRFSRDLIEL